MHILKLVLKNALRHKLRTVLTVLGISIAVMSFGFMRTIVTAWYAGVEASATNRMITRHAVSFIFPLPLAYRDQIAKIPDVAAVSYANWFGGVYKDASNWENFFPRLAIDPETYFELYPEFIVSSEHLAAFKKERNACLVGRKIARTHGLQIGDVLPIEGDIYPGQWSFVIRGFYTGRDETIDETQMLFHWKYLDEQIAIHQPGRAGNIGWFILKVENPRAMPNVALAVDDNFRNSRAGTKTETEKEFQQSFISMSSAIITSLEVISVIIIGIILLVLANTIVMAARERTTEYAVLKTLGFSSFHIAALIGGESLLISCLGGIIGLAATFPLAGAFAKAFPTFFPVFNIETVTIIIAASVALLAGLIAASFPVARSIKTKIADGLRAVG